jgi:hypothetical protein
MLPPGYFLDESDPDILVLRRLNDTVVAAFSAQGATRVGTIEAALQDFGGRVASEPHDEVTARDVEDA